jgi:hypothetical protein
MNIKNNEEKNEENGIAEITGVCLPVHLRVYDLSNGMAKALSKQFLGIEIDGVWHTSIEVFGMEYFFHNSLRFEKIGACSFGTLFERIELGKTDCTKEQFEDFFKSCHSTWNEKTYDLIENNCNNFTNWIANFLVNRDIPEYILTLPEKVKNCENFKKMFGRGR